MTLVLLDNDSAPQIVDRIPQGEARREHTLRDMIHDNPAILPVHEFDPGYGRVFTVARELNIPGVGFVDVLLADERGRLVVVECKLWRNPQARREVVGQILDYARELSRYGYEDLQRQVSIATRLPGNALYTLACAAGGTLSEAEFVDRVSRDLAAGRFLLLIGGDGITEGTRRIGEYLRGQPGLAFDFGLIEFAEYRARRSDGSEQIIVQPRILAQTVVVERHVIRNEVPGIIIDPVDTSPVSATGQPPSEGSRMWGEFVERFAADTRFDDPAQQPPRRGGNGWMKVPLPGSLYVNLYRASSNSTVGAQIRFPGEENAAAWAECFADREAIEQEFARASLDPPSWNEGDVPSVSLVIPSPAPWDEAEQARQREWMGQAANQFVNSFRPRLQAIYR